MSEKNSWILVALIPVIGVLFALTGYVEGEVRGRAEMKHWQDDWYAENPVTKIDYREGPPTRVYVAKDGEEYDAVIRGWIINLHAASDRTCISLSDNKSRVLIENIMFMEVDSKAPDCQLIAPIAFSSKPQTQRGH